MRELSSILSNPELIASIIECEKQVTPILQKYLTNFPDYTDHSIDHSKKVLDYTFYLLGDNINSLNEDEKYILIMSAYLHDIGMCPSKEDKQKLLEENKIESDADYIELIRNIHHKLSYKFVEENWKSLKIPNKKYAHAIGLVSMGHRKVNLFDFDVYQHEYIVKGGSEFVCLPFLASILRLADELDITNDRTPDLLFNKYYPENKISKDEWEKHRANYFVNFKNERIIITAECSDLNIYYALKDQKNKIESVVKDVQKLIRLLPIDRKDLTIKFHYIDQNISTKGFIPKEIGFSFDFQNTFNAFIGRNLYDSDFIALREVIQNAIDACLYKKTLNHVYEPCISVNLIDKKLIIDDNGLGMDYFIIENYFAKLNSSYYQQSKISKLYESISQFGVGVFSYFLLCDYFDVETKSKNDEAIKFRVTKNAESSFYFFDNPLRKKEGTKITMYLKENVNFNDIIERIEFDFKYIDIPLKLSDNAGNIYEIAKKPFNEDKSKLISENVNILAKDRIPELDILDCRLNTDTFEGLVNLFVIKKEKQIYPESLYKVINDPFYNNYNVYNKGIYINTFKRIFLDYTIGNINIKSKQILNLSRNQFKNDYAIVDILATFEKTIIRQVFEAWSTLPINDQFSFINKFIYNYIDLDYIDIELIEILKNYWIFKIYKDNRVSYIKFNKLLKLESFILLDEYFAIISRGTPSKSFENIYENFNKPVVLIFNSKLTENMIKILKVLKINIQMVASKDNHYFMINTKEKKEYFNKILNYFEHFPFINDKAIIAYPNINVSRYFNSKHPIISYIINNNDIIYKNSSLKKLFDEFLSLIHELIFNLHMRIFPYKFKNDLERVNQILFHLNSITDTNFKITKSDFPLWVLSMLQKQSDAKE